MKKIFSLLLAVTLVFGMMPVSVFASSDGNTATVQVEEKKKELETKYGIGITYPTDGAGDALIAVNSLVILDMALENATPAVVKQVSRYYKDKNGKRLTFQYIKNQGNLSGQDEAILAGFDNQRSVIELYIPHSSDEVIATGENPISIIHEFGHAFHFMYTDKYGHAKMQAEWEKMNGKYSYSNQNTTMDNPNTKVFVTGYAASAFAEDVAETFAHVFARNKPGQGFSNRLYTDGKQTALGKKVAYVEKMLTTDLTGTEKAVENYKKIYSTPNSVSYQGMRFSGEYLQFAGYPQPKYVLNGTLRNLGMEKSRAVWLRSLGGWYVKETRGKEIIVFPGGVWCEVGPAFQAPASAA